MERTSVPNKAWPYLRIQWHQMCIVDIRRLHAFSVYTKVHLQLSLQPAPTHLPLLTTLHTHLIFLGPVLVSTMAIEGDEKKGEYGTDIASTASADITAIGMSEHGAMKRALKPRHSQMIALGGCVGMFPTKLNRS